MIRRRWLILVLVITWGFWSWGWFFPPRPRVGPLVPVSDGGRRVTLVFAPHSDDEVLAAGGLLQQAATGGPPPRVVLVTGGDAFTLAAKLYYRRWTLTPQDMLAFGKHRAGESRSGLVALGLPSENLLFLGYPDREIHSLWTTCWGEEKPCTGPFTQVSQVRYEEARTPGAPYTGKMLLQEIIGILQEVRPGLVVYPHPNDAHLDHWGVSSFVTAALEQLRRSDSTWQPPEEWLYLVHRGDWPAPKGYRPYDQLLPPEKLAGDSMTDWREVPLSKEQVERKHQAITQYQTQVQVLQRYMYSFVRGNELFGTMSRIDVPPAKPWDTIAADRDLPGTLEDGVPPWSGLVWHMVIADPHADTVAREVQRGADILRVWSANDGQRLYLAVRTAAPTRAPVSFGVRGRGYSVRGGWGELFDLALFPGGRLATRQWSGSAPGDLAVTSEANWTRIDLPLSALGDSAALMINVETHLDNLLIDRSAWRLLSLDGR